jgi:glutamate formiminotransferase/formiminotetrahydrofolate cyclodeaminase
VPGGGSAAALAGAIAGALVAMVARLTIGRKAYAEVDQQARQLLEEADRLRTELRQRVDDDAEAYTRVSAAYKRPKDDPERARAVDGALLGAAAVPLAVGGLAARVRTLAAEIGRIGNRNARSDATVGDALARAAIVGAVENVRVNVAALSDPAAGKDLLAQADALAAEAATDI